MKNNKKLIKTLSFVLIYIFNFILPGRIYAQIISDVEKATRQPDILNRPEDIQRRFFEVPPAPEEYKPEERRPLEEPEKKFFVEKIILDGCESIPCRSFNYLIKPYEGKEVTVQALEDLTKDIQNEYLKKGILAAVFVPEQEIENKIVNLQVVEAKLGELIINDHKYFNDNRLLYYWKIKKGEVINLNKISRSIQLMNKNPDRQVRADLRAGKEPGTTDVILSADTRFPFHLNANTDNEGSPSTGEWRNAVGIRHNNILGIDDTLLSQYLFAEYYNGFYVYHSLPITPYGTSFLYGHSQVLSEPEEEIGNVFGITSEAITTSVSIHQDIFQKDKYLGEVFLSFDAKDKTISLDAGTYNRDRLRVLGLGGTYVIRKPGSNSSIFGVIYQGLNAFGASKNNNPLASRNAKSRFTKIYLDARNRRFLNEYVQLNLRFMGQSASTKLMPQEEFSLGGSDSVRGYPAGDYLADNAAVQNIEIVIAAFYIPESWQIFPMQETLRNSLTNVFFIDHGWGNKRGVLAGERKSADFTGVGLGFRLDVTENSFVRLEWGFPVGDKTITEAANSIFHFYGSVQF